MTTPTFADLWSRYERWQVAQALVASVAELPGPASNRHLDGMERTIGELSPLRELLSYHDGDLGADGLRFFSAAEIAHTWIEHGKHYDEHDDAEAYECLTDDQRAREIPFHPGRIAFADVNEVVYLCIDRIPGPKGRPGQILSMAAGITQVIADDLAAFFEYLVLLGESGLTIHDKRLGLWAEPREKVLGKLRLMTAKKTKIGSPEKGSQKGSQLFRAAEQDNVDAIAELLDAGAPINWQDRGGCTPLVAACRSRAWAAASLLVDRGADIDKKSIGPSALMEAAYHGNEALVGRLIDRGADVNAADQHGNTAVFLAISGAKIYEGAQLTILRQLLDAGADPNAWAGAYGIAPLHEASGSRLVDAVDALLEFGANPDRKSRSGETPIASAIEHSLDPALDDALAAVVQRLLDGGAGGGRSYFRGKPATVAREHGLLKTAALLVAHPRREAPPKKPPRRRPPRRRPPRRRPPRSGSRPRACAAPTYDWGQTAPRHPTGAPAALPAHPRWSGHLRGDAQEPGVNGGTWSGLASRNGCDCRFDEDGNIEVTCGFTV